MIVDEEKQASKLKIFDLAKKTEICPILTPDRVSGDRRSLGLWTHVNYRTR